MNLRPNRFRSIPTVPPNPRIIAGYSLEMLDAGISQLSNVGNRGAWEQSQLTALQAERAKRGGETKPAERTAA